MTKIIKKCEFCNNEYGCRSDKINTSRFCSTLCLTTYCGRKSVKNLREKWEAESKEETLYKKKIALEKFFEKLPGCWEWQGSRKHKLPYGNFTFRRKPFLAHRVSYEIYIGPIPSNMIILHKCDNPPCVKPEHLYAGTYLDNHKDKMARGRCKVEKLNVDQVKKIKELLKTKMPDSHIAQKFGVSPTTIGSIKKERTWSWVTLDD